MKTNSVTVTRGNGPTAAELRAQGILPPLGITVAMPPPEDASVATKAVRLFRETKRWLKKGAKIAPKKARQHRHEQCKVCPYYNGSGNFFLGECRAPKCGCSRLKLFYATVSCPLPQPRWKALKYDKATNTFSET